MKRKDTREALENKLRSLSWPEPTPELRRRTLDATRRALAEDPRNVQVARPASWWTEGLLAAAVVLLALGVPQLAPSDPPASSIHGRSSADESLRELQKVLGPVPLGYATGSGKRGDDAPRRFRWVAARPT